jgi:threonine dehydratase
MPMNAPNSKRAAAQSYGANVVSYDPATTSREELTREIAERTGAALIPPFDHLQVIAGQGTVAVELFDQVGPLDALLVPCGGGGLLSGVSVAARHLAPDCRVLGVEPALADDATRSFYSGVLQRVHNPATIADGTRVSSLGELTFPLIREFTSGMCVVSEEAIEEAVRFLLLRLKTVVEPSGALGVAALESGAADVTGKVGVILSGGNVDGAVLADILERSSTG